VSVAAAALHLGPDGDEAKTDELDEAADAVGGLLQLVGHVPVCMSVCLSVRPSVRLSQVLQFVGLRVLLRVL